MAEEQVAWTAMPYRAPVLDADGNPIGTAESLLGDEAEDIFHGIALKRHSDGKIVEIAADSISRITTRHVYTNLSADGVKGLQPYQEERWYHLGWGGLFRKHPEWRQGNR